LTLQSFDKKRYYERVRAKKFKKLALQVSKCRFCGRPLQISGELEFDAVNAPFCRQCKKQRRALSAARFKKPRIVGKWMVTSARPR
jgi:hypothetical protein